MDCPTLKIKSKVDGQIYVINESDFDSEKHSKLSGAADAEKSNNTSVDKKAMKAFLDSKGVKYAGNISAKDLEALYEEHNQPAAAFTVVEKDGIFAIVDALGAQYGEDTYKTAEDAQAMADLLVGK